MSEALLAVDLGIRAGFALYGDDGRLRRYRSVNFGSVARLKRAIPGILEDEGDAIRRLVVEGTRSLADVWERHATKRGITVTMIDAETWRKRLLFARQQRRAGQAKANAGVLAREVINWSDAQRPTSLRHDAAEAILIGLWGVLDCGWLGQLPAELKHS
jgi:hypothetical protein